jgi:hypothetical protein
MAIAGDKLNIVSFVVGSRITVGRFSDVTPLALASRACLEPAVVESSPSCAGDLETLHLRQSLGVFRRSPKLAPSS